MAGRADEIGGLARSLNRLEHDVGTQLAELRTLLDTSNAVVNLLDPRAVGGTIIREIRRLVDVQAAAVLAPDDAGVLRVLVSDGRDEPHDRATHVRLDDVTRPAALALRDPRPVQMIAEEGSLIIPASREPDSADGLPARVGLRDYGAGQRRGTLLGAGGTFYATAQGAARSHRSRCSARIGRPR